MTIQAFLLIVSMAKDSIYSMVARHTRLKLKKFFPLSQLLFSLSMQELPSTEIFQIPRSACVAHSARKVSSGKKEERILITRDQEVPVTSSKTPRPVLPLSSPSQSVQLAPPSWGFVLLTLLYQNGETSTIVRNRGCGDCGRREEGGRKGRGMI